MNTYLNPLVGRRGVLRRLLVGTVAAATSAELPVPARASTHDDSRRRWTYYRTNSSDVQTFYRVNRYPVMRGRRSC